MRSHRPTAPASTPRETPIRRQFEALKAQNPGCLLLFQLGDFYESFEDDAGVVARVCGVTLTSRELGKTTTSTAPRPSAAAATGGPEPDLSVPPAHPAGGAAVRTADRYAGGASIRSRSCRGVTIATPR